MSSMVESVANHDSSIEIQVLVRKGHGQLYFGNPKINKVWEFDKSEKLKNIIKLGYELKREFFTVIFNCHRFVSSSFIAFLAKPKTLIGYNKNPLSIFFTKKVAHQFDSSIHEIDRNHSLLQSHWASIENKRPRLYPSSENYRKIENFNSNEYVVIAPSSVWFTKQYPIQGWRNLISRLADVDIFLIGAPHDKETCNQIAAGFSNTNVLAGELSLMESIALIGKATKVYACDSAPTHMATAMNVETHTVFCSTDSSFGFGPKADRAFIHESNVLLKCRPCGIHGKKICPEGHFSCAKYDIEV